MNVTSTHKTQTLFFGVGENQGAAHCGPDGDGVVEPGLKDQAARVRFMKREGEDRPDIQGRILSVSPDGKTMTVETRDEASRYRDRPSPGACTRNRSTTTFCKTPPNRCRTTRWWVVGEGFQDHTGADSV